MAIAAEAKGELPGSQRGLRLSWRLLAAILAVVVGGLAVRHSLGLAFAYRQPNLARAIDRENAIATGQAAFLSLSHLPSGQAQDHARRFAQEALARDASNVTALVTFGLTERTARVSDVFALAERLSRRNLAAELWLIEAAVARGDIAGALRHYDVALRTNEAAPSVLFPVLIGAASDPAVRTQIARTLTRRPRWGGLYLQQLAQSATDRVAAAMLFITLKQNQVPTGAAADAALFARLLEDKQYDAAWAVYEADHPGAVRDGVRAPTFAPQPPIPTVFDWVVGEGDYVTAQIDRLPSGAGELSYATEPGEGGEIARQTLVLRPGSYRVSVEAQISDGGDAQPYLEVRCLATPAALIRLPLRPAGTTTGVFSVPSGCGGQALALAVDSSGAMAKSDGRVRRVQITRAS